MQREAKLERAQDDSAPRAAHWGARGERRGAQESDLEGKARPGESRLVPEEAQHVQRPQVSERPRPSGLGGEGRKGEAREGPAGSHGEGAGGHRAAPTTLACGTSPPSEAGSHEGLVHRSDKAGLGVGLAAGSRSSIWWLQWTAVTSPAHTWSSFPRAGLSPSKGT